MNNKLRVFVRCRPLRGTEARANIFVDEDHGQICVNENRSFQFDDVFSEESKQIDVYMIVVSPLVQDILLGYNCSVFAYGPTGTGKTFTMEGETIDESMGGWEADSLCGIIPRTISQLFETLEEKSPEYYEVKVSFLELYNEEAYDLLSPMDDTRKLKIYDNGPKQIVDGLQEVLVKNRADLHTILIRGSSKRATAATQLNACSSRSHTIFTITVRTSEGKNGRINLIDLAGSENIRRSGAQDIRAREAGSINQSLLTLGRVIKALVDKAPHVPYRESKLTRLLQNSLGGTTKTSLIATISPSNGDLDDTLNTLEYATRAKGVTNKVVVNQSILSVSANQANEMIENLKQQLLLQEFKIRNEVAKEYRKESNRVKQYFENIHNEEMKEFTQKINESHAEIHKLKNEMTVLNQKLLDTNSEFDQFKDEVDKLKPENEILSKQLNDIKSENDKLKEQIDNSGRESGQLITDLRKQLDDVHSENDKLKEQIDNSARESGQLITDLRKQLDDVHSENDKLKEKIDNSARESGQLITDLRKQLDDVLSENDNLKRQLESSDQGNLELIAKLNKQLDAVQSQNDKLKSEVEECQLRILDLDEENRELRKEVAKSDSEINRLKEELQFGGKPPSQDCSPIVTPKIGSRKITRVKKNILDVSGDYANVTFNNEDEIAQVDNPRAKKKVISCTKKREINQAITLSGKKRKLQSQDEQVELSPIVTKRVTRSRKKLVY